MKLVAEPSLGPPMLTPEGARVQPDWLYAFLRGPINIRPWLDVRMPTFGLDDHNLNGVIQYFGAVSNTIGPFQTPEIVRASNTEAVGKQLFELLKCQQCHVLGVIPKEQPTANLAPDLRMASDRLQPEWILEWLKKPSDILPGTRMPAFWPDYPKSSFPQTQRRRGSADPRDSRSSAHVQRWSDAPAEWHCGCKRELNSRQDRREGREWSGRKIPIAYLVRDHSRPTRLTCTSAA